jgi:hypothetical protein
MKPVMSPITVRYGAFESDPAIFNWHEAWILGVGDIWREFNATEVLFHAGIMTKEKFEKTYGALPALPKHAFVRTLGRTGNLPVEYGVDNAGTLDKRANPV